jgi:hypothetical protein
MDPKWCHEVRGACSFGFGFEPLLHCGGFDGHTLVTGDARADLHY